MKNNNIIFNPKNIIFNSKNTDLEILHSLLKIEDSMLTQSIEIDQVFDLLLFNSLKTNSYIYCFIATVEYPVPGVFLIEEASIPHISTIHYPTKNFRDEQSPNINITDIVRDIVSSYFLIAKNMMINSCNYQLVNPHLKLPDPNNFDDNL